MCWKVVCFLDGTCDRNLPDVLESCIGPFRRQGSTLQVHKEAKRLGTDLEVWAKATPLDISGAVVRRARQERGDACAGKSNKLTQSISISTALFLLTLAAGSGWLKTVDAGTFCDVVLEASLRKTCSVECAAECADSALDAHVDFRCDRERDGGDTRLRQRRGFA